MTTMNKVCSIFLFTWLTLALVTCGKKTITDIDVIKQYSEVVYLTYLDSLNTAILLQEEIEIFLENPSKGGMEKVKTAWINARRPYGESEAFRFYAGPIDDENGPEGRLNAWPMDEQHIDYVESDASTGIINNDSTEISQVSLAEMNENPGETDIATGYHAIEFLIWGQDLSDGPGGGQRSHTDYVEGKAKNVKRRKKYLKTVTELLVNDLRSLVEAWSPNQKNYRYEFIAKSDENVKKILFSLVELSKGELSGERMAVALESREREDEHSCFSDNTHNDIIHNAQGILNVYTGSYTKADGQVHSGPSLNDLIANKYPEIAQKIKTSIEDSLEKAKAIQAPFDQEIKVSNKEGNARIQVVIDQLRTQADLLLSIAQKMGMEIKD